MSSPVTLKRPPELTDHRLGSLDSNIIIVEYADFLCPFSSGVSKVVDQVLSRYKDICFIFRHFPLTNIHPYAGIAAMASEAAAEQGKFWEMHEILFSHQSEIGPESVFNLARELKLDMKKFLNDIEDETLLQKVQNDFKSGIDSSVDGTPTIFVNGLSFEGEITFEGLSEEIDQILNDNQPSA